jgi:hypothetical protein
LAGIVERVLQNCNLSGQLLAVAGNNASNNSTMQRALESSPSEQDIHWDAESMAINCMMHILNQSAKTIFMGLYATYSSSYDDDDETSEIDATFEAASDELSNTTERYNEMLLIGITVFKGSTADQL